MVFISKSNIFNQHLKLVFEMKLHAFIVAMVSWLFSVSTASLAAQSLEGYVVDSLSEKGLPYANVSLNLTNKGTSTSEEGHFQLSIATYTPQDSLVISFIGYQPQTIAVSDALQQTELLVKLQPEASVLDEVVVTNSAIAYSAGTENLGVHHKRTAYPMSVPFGYEVATLIDNPQHKAGRLEAMQFKLKEKEKEGYTIFKAYFRLSFYEVNNGFPGAYLSSANIIIAPDGSNTVKIPLEAYHIRFPETGLFVGIETIAPEDHSQHKGMYLTTPNILFTHTDTQRYFKRYRGKEWTQQQSKSVFKPKLYNVPYMKLKVRYRK